MKINNVSFDRTAVEPRQYPTDMKPEIAFVGRSNVGKSSLINYLVNRKALARVSSAPGKTRVINFYNIEEMLYFVDLPGYGYAKVSHKEKEQWGKMIEQYLSTRVQLKLLVLLVDIRHEPTEQDRMMIDWVRYFKLDYIILATKADKIGKKEIEENLKVIKTILDVKNDTRVIPVSAEKHIGREEVLEIIDKKLEQH